ncbi:MAG: tyrosine--tRNA ligase, partial [Chitinophagales bacterium]
YMLAKDSVQSRMEKGLSFTEFSYQLIQGYDFYYLWKHKQVMLQMGGSDQWGNITTGNELIRRMEGGEAFALCTPLIKKADGTKFGKTESGNIWLDAKKTSPYKFYQFWLNASDADAENYLKIFTLFNRTETEDIIEQHRKEPHLRNLQKVLAKDITCRVHSETEFIKAQEASEILFGKSTTEALKELDEQTFLDVFEGVPTFNVSISEGISITDLLTTATTIIASKSELRRALQENSLSINKQKITDSEALIQSADLINNKYLLVQRGKKNYFLIIAE